MKKIDCPMCTSESKSWPCTKHEYRPGQIHSGAHAPIDTVWDCPHCQGQGHFLLSWFDYQLLKLARRLESLRRSIDGV